MNREFERQVPDAEEQRPSKSQVKRDLLALQKLGERLVGFDQGALEELSLSEKLREALHETRGIHSHGARRRQIRWIGKLLRGEDVDAIRDLVDAKDAKTRGESGKFHAVERWRDRLLEEGAEALSEFLDAHPQADRQHVHGLIRLARKEQAADKPPAAKRKLFRYLKELVG